MNFHDLNVYKKALEIGDICWNIVPKWNYLEKDTIGKQLVKSSDFVEANVFEGFGRFHYKENKHFNYIALGSLFGIKTLIDKASAKNITDNDVLDKAKKDITDTALMRNAYISKIGSNTAVKLKLNMEMNLLITPF